MARKTRFVRIGIVAFQLWGAPVVAQVDPLYNASRPPFLSSSRAWQARSWLPDGPPNLSPQRRKACWLSIALFTSRGSGGQQWGATAVLALPFDRTALSRGGFSEPTTIEPAPEGLLVLPVSPDVARLAVSASWKAAALEPDEHRLNAMLSRARWSAVLPETRLRALRTQDEQVRVDTADDRQRLLDRNGVRLWLEARLTWRLDRILYGGEEPSIERIRSMHQEARTRLAHQTLEALFKWQRAWLEYRESDPATRGGRDAVLRLAETAATLDVLTGGWFTRWQATSVPLIDTTARKSDDTGTSARKGA